MSGQDAADRHPRVVGLLAIALCLLYAGLMAYGSWGYIARLMKLGITAEDIPMKRWLLTIILPIGFVLLGIRLLEQAVAIVSGKAAGFELADEAAEVLHEQGLPAPGRRTQSPDRQVDAMTTAFLFVSLFVFMLIGMPIAISLGLVERPDHPAVRQRLARLAVAQVLFRPRSTTRCWRSRSSSWPATFMTTGGVARRMIDFANRLRRPSARRARDRLACWPACCSPPSPAPRRPPWSRSARS